MQNPRQNSLLQKLPAGKRELLLSFSTTVSLEPDTVLFEAATTPHYGHFLTSGIVKLVVPLRAGKGVECGLTGSDGIPEGLHLQGSGSIPVRGVVQVPATAVRIPFTNLQELFRHDDDFRHLVLTFNQLQANISCLVANCNALHSVQKRLVRLLLMTADRCSELTVPITQDCLSRMIGARRTTVSRIANQLQGDGLIEYKRGSLRILNLQGLKKIACEWFLSLRQLRNEFYLRAC